MTHTILPLGFASIADVTLASVEIVSTATLDEHPSSHTTRSRQPRSLSGTCFDGSTTSRPMPLAQRSATRRLRGSVAQR